MKWSVKVARVAGTDVKIHLTFLFLLAWIGFSYYLRGGAGAAIDGIVFILLLFLCVLLHEFGHILAARRYGIRTPDVTLLPIGGVARLERMPEKPSQEIIVALAGPMVNVVIAAVLFAIGAVADAGEAVSLESPSVGLLPKLLSVNVALFLFNMIPAFPMDGGRVLRALLAIRMSYVRATTIAATIGQGLALLFGFIGLFYNPLLVFVAMFVYLAASQEAQAVRMRGITVGLPVSAAMITDFRVLPTEATIDNAIEALLRTSQREFPVVDAGGAVQGILTREAMITALKSSGPQAPVADFMVTGVRAARVNESFDDAFRIMQEANGVALPVLDQSGRLVGLVTQENVAEMMMVRSTMERDKDGNIPW